MSTAPWVRANAFAEQWAAVRVETHAAVERVGASGWYILGREVETFERALAGRIGVGNVIGCASGLDAIELALRALELPPGTRVLTTPLSAFASALAIVRAGGVPVFVDVDDTGCLDLDAASAVLAADGIRWMVPVHLYGNAMDARRLTELKSKHDLFLVEDCAQAIGAQGDGRPPGLVGQAAAVSFYPTKNLGALGDAGALWTSSTALANKARQLRDYGQVAKYEHALLGLNSRLDEVHAAVLHDALLPRLDGWIARRREIGARYRTEISSSYLELPALSRGSASGYHLFPLLVADPDALMKHLRAQQIDSGRHYPSLIPDQAALSSVPFEVKGDLAKARRFACREVSIPIHPFLSDSDVDRVVEACNEYAP